MKRNSCIVCGAKLNSQPIFRCKNMPATSQNLPTFEQLDNDRTVDFELCQCSGCGLVQFDNEPVSYYRDSTRAGERCDVLIKLRQQQYKHFIETYHLQGKKLVEIGAGKGGFLKTLKDLTEYDMKEYGIEYNSEFVKYAREEVGVNVQQGNPENEDTLIDGAPFDAFTSFAYPARLIHPNSMMQCIYNNTTEKAIGLIMVPSMEHLLNPGGYYDITADHIAYYDASTLRFMVQRNGFEVIEQGDVADMYIYAIIRKRPIYDLAKTWSDIDLFTKDIVSFVACEKRNNRKIAIWCAGHFAFTVLSLTNIANDIEYIIDNAEFKKGKYSPGSHVLIEGPEYYAQHPVDTIMILGPIYVKEIISEIYGKCSQTIKIVTVDKFGLHDV